MNPLKRAALFAALAAFAFALILHRDEHAWPVLVGRLIATTLGLWGLSGLCVFLGKRANVVSNWLTTVIVMGVLMSLGTLAKKHEGPYIRELKLSDGTVQRVEFERDPSAADLAEAKAYYEGFREGRK